MIAIKCQNKFIDKKDELRECNRFLGAISSRIAMDLKEHPEESIVFRCPQCSPLRFISVHGNNAGMLVQETMTEDKISGGVGIDEVENAEQLY